MNDAEQANKTTTTKNAPVLNDPVMLTRHVI